VLFPGCDSGFPHCPAGRTVRVQHGHGEHRGTSAGRCGEGAGGSRAVLERHLQGSAEQRRLINKLTGKKETARHLLPVLCSRKHRISSRQSAASHLFSRNMTRCFPIPVGFSQVWPLFRRYRVSSSIFISGGTQSVECAGTFPG